MMTNPNRMRAMWVGMKFFMVVLLLFYSNLQSKYLIHKQKLNILGPFLRHTFVTY